MAIAEAALLAEVLASPGDDAPRLVWADAQGGERGELVVLQCELARGSRSPADAGAFRRRERELVARHGRAWSGLEGLARRCRFRRGFVELATFRPATFCEHADAIFEAAPLLASIELEDVTEVAVALVLEHPSFARVRGFALPIGVAAQFDDVLERAAANHAFVALASLKLQQLGPRAARALVASRQLGGLERLAVSGDVSSDGTLPALLATTTRLRALDLYYQQRPERLVPALPRTLTELAIAADALNALAASPLAARLERLMVTDVRGAGVLPLLAAFPMLRSLDLHTHTSTVLEPVAFAGSWLPPMLRELRWVSLSPESAREAAEAYGAQLELLEVNGLDPELADELQPLVAGDLFANPLAATWPPLFAGELPRAPMWDYPVVRF